jgi:glycosyltransferase involved in cell wall biosynthesis
MKIIFVVDGLWVGGTERSLAEMLPQLVQAKIYPTIVCLRPRPEEGVEKEVVERGFDVRFVTGSSFVSKVLQLRNILRTEKPAIVHSSLFQANLVTRLAAIHLPVTVLSSLVNTPYEQVRYQDPAISAIRLKAIQRIDGWTSRHLTTHFHAVSSSAKESAVRNLRIPENRITVVRRGRDASRLGVLTPARRQQTRQALDIPDQNIVITNVGRHEYQKGQKCLLEAFANLSTNYSQLILLIAGRTGSSSQELMEIRDTLDLTQTVRFLGHCENIPDILAATDLFVLPSLFEGLSGALIEAMALGLPVVASDIPPNREVLEDGKNAILVRPGSSVALADAVQVMLENHDLRKKFSLRSREIFEERFTLDKSAFRMIELYRKLINESPQQTIAGVKDVKGEV